MGIKKKEGIVDNGKCGIVRYDKDISSIHIK